MAERKLPLNVKLEEHHLRALVGSGVPEGQTLEYKREYLPVNDEGKRKFLRAICAFANAQGGDLIMGMQEQAGSATELVPLSGLNVDECGRQIGDIVRDSVTPRIGGLTVELVSLPSGSIVVVRVSKSWTGPHMLTFRDSPPEFYIRHGASKGRMEYEEISEAFSAGETTMARLRNFRTERCAAILVDDTPLPLGHSAAAVLHILPLDMLANPRRLDVRRLQRECQSLDFCRQSGTRADFDFGGCLLGGTSSAKVQRYAYVFLNGAVEIVDSRYFDPDTRDGKVIRHTHMERSLSDSAKGFLQMLTDFGVTPPYLLMLALLNVQGYAMDDPEYMFLTPRPVSRDHLYMNGVVLEDPKSDLREAMFPLFCPVWNACGMPQSQNYDDKGKWLCASKP